MRSMRFMSFDYAKSYSMLTFCEILFDQIIVIGVADTNSLWNATVDVDFKDKIRKKKRWLCKFGSIKFMCCHYQT